MPRPAQAAPVARARCARGRGTTFERSKARPARRPTHGAAPPITDTACVHDACEPRCANARSSCEPPCANARCVTHRPPRGPRRWPRLVARSSGTASRTASAPHARAYTWSGAADRTCARARMSLARAVAARSPRAARAGCRRWRAEAHRPRVPIARVGGGERLWCGKGGEKRSRRKQKEAHLSQGARDRLIGSMGIDPIT